MACVLMRDLCYTIVMDIDKTYESLKYRISVGGGTTTYRNANGDLHREEGPAYIEHSGYKAWWLNGQRHRENGPAVVFPNGRVEYWVNGVRTK